MLTVTNSAHLGGTFIGYTIVTFQVSHTGLYTMAGHCSGNEINSAQIQVTGSGVVMKDSSGSTVTGVHGKFTNLTATLKSGLCLGPVLEISL